jgi:hypothetical protein
MIEPSLLPRFHQHLMILQQSGFDVGSRLISEFAIPKAGSDSLECLGLMQYRLSQLESIIRAQLAAGEKPEDLILPTLAGVNANYLSAFLQWRDSGQQLSSLEPLIVQHRSDKMVRQGFRHLWLNLFCYLVFGTVAIISVALVARPAIKNLVEQLRVEPPWLLSSLLSPAAPIAISILLAMLALLLLAGRWVWPRMLALSLRSQEGLSTFKLSGLSAQHFSRNDSRTAPPLPREELSKASVNCWACDSSCDAEESTKRKAFALQFYEWLKSYRSRRQRRAVPRLFSIAVGGALTLAIGLLLFAPMVQLLIFVINTAGLGR